MKNEIIRILQQNARISNTAMGEMLGITSEQAAAEIHKLEEEGIIRGYSVILDDEKYDNSTVYATIELKVTPQRDCVKSQAHLLREILHLPWLKQCRKICVFPKV